MFSRLFKVLYNIFFAYGDVLLQSDVNMTNKLGKKIKALRKEKGYTLEKLADMAETSKSYIWELENREFCNPAAGKLKKIADALGATIEFLTNDEDNLSSADLKEALFRKFNKLNKYDKKKIEQII